MSTVTVTCEPLPLEVRAADCRGGGATLCSSAASPPASCRRFKGAMMPDSEQLAQRAGFVPSLENLDFVMEHDALGHVVMDQVQGPEALVRLRRRHPARKASSEVARELLRFLRRVRAEDPDEKDPLGRSGHGDRGVRPEAPPPTRRGTRGSVYDHGGRR